ncbi:MULTISPECIES: TetR/AcrR family transcriptional regulator [Catenuloplanes]|uniref:AcrR family transcriptional regulator n=1 Tax=Catenuloplanes niger TaxID=587534 RepID=A0AAE3ZZB8_9ACTN|nr:TetR/AcrR family transcriptional regulator [Catenuloplanes niger]MDR7328014.1 AcrR family transcriptional regulator [Catenuloplanes niger]
MSFASAPLGRRERNKQEKLDRIIAAAAALFAEHGVDEVTTQQIADAADIGTGTLFLYAKTKGELLLLVQNTHYAHALDRGIAAAETEPDVLDAITAVVAQVVACNRVQVDNGRTYLREMVFGDPTEPRHRAALTIVNRTEAAIATLLQRDPRIPVADTATLAHVVSAVMFLELSVTANIGATPDALTARIREHVRALLPR